MKSIKFEELSTYLATDTNFVCELGEQTGIGASSLLVRICGKTILIDRGIAFEGHGINKITTFPIGEDLENIHIDVIIFTHVHADHSGLIIPTVKWHPESKIIFSKNTYEELHVTLADTLIVQQKVAREAFFANKPAPNTIFDERDLKEFLKCAERGDFEIIDTDTTNKWLTFDDIPGFTFGFTFSGHTYGAFITLIKCPNGDGLVFTGDVSGHNQETTRGVKTLSEEFLAMANFRDCKRIILITEATNGDHDRAEPLEVSDARLKSVLEETKRQGGVALFGVFMVNRGPNIVAKLVRLGFNVFVAGGVRNTLAVEVGTETLNRWLADRKVIFLERGLDYMSQVRAASTGDKYGNDAVVTSSATLDQGAVVPFAIEMLSNPNNVLISTGHVFDGSTMQDVLLKSDQPIELGRTVVFSKFYRGQETKIPVNVRCRTAHFDYTAHSYRSELVEFATALQPDAVLVKHCTVTGFNGLKTALHDNPANANLPIERLENLHLYEF